jgi:acetoin utilization protein AcuC
VLTVSLHQNPATLFPGTGHARDVGAGDAAGTAVNVALPPGTDDDPWLRAFHAVVPSVVRAFRPELLVTQCGCDSHARDPLTDLALSVDAQRAAYLALHDLAHEVCDGRWVALGGGGYALTGVVPVSWTHLLAVAAGAPLSPETETPPAWRRRVREHHLAEPPVRMTDGAPATWRRWDHAGDDLVDQAIDDTRRAVFPLLGLDPMDPRD